MYAGHTKDDETKTDIDDISSLWKGAQIMATTQTS